jgi:hypothetical protein
MFSVIFCWEPTRSRVQISGSGAATLDKSSIVVNGVFARNLASLSFKPKNVSVPLLHIWPPMLPSLYESADGVFFAQAYGVAVRMSEYATAWPDHLTFLLGERLLASPVIYSIQNTAHPSNTRVRKYRSFFFCFRYLKGLRLKILRI